MAYKSSINTDSISKKGNDIVNEAVSSMQEILELAEKGMGLIHDTAVTINDISDSTREMAEVVGKSPEIKRFKLRIVSHLKE